MSQAADPIVDRGVKTPPAIGAQRPAVRQRLISAVVGLPILLSLVWFGGWYYVFGVLVCAVWSAVEVYLMGRRAGYSPSPVILVGGTAALTVAPFVPGLPADSVSLVLLTVVLVASLAYLVSRSEKGQTALHDFLLSLGGAAYLGLLFGYLVALRLLPDGRGWLVLLLLGTFASDTAAYVVGRAWGRHKLAPVVSPNKTREGAIGGLAIGTLANLALIALLGLPLGLGAAIVVGVLMNLAGQLGDLAESALKRGLQAKDAGGLIPGHGGMLDRADSLLVAGVMLYYTVRAFEQFG